MAGSSWTPTLWSGKSARWIPKRLLRQSRLHALQRRTRRLAFAGSPRACHQRLDLAQPREQIVLDRHAFSTPAHGKDYLARRSAKIKAGQTLSTTDRVGQTAVTNNAAERRMRPLGRKNYLFAGSLEGGRRAAIIYTLVGTADLNGWNPQAYLRVLLERIADHPINRIGDLAPWNLQHETI